MKEFNVIVWDFNAKKFKPYDVLPVLINSYKNPKRKNLHKVTNDEEFKKWLVSESIYRFWSKCEWEIVLSPWPPSETEPFKDTEKIDVYRQIEMNLDLLIDTMKPLIKYDK